MNVDCKRIPVAEGVNAYLVSASGIPVRKTNEFVMIIDRSGSMSGAPRSRAPQILISGSI